jgi:hypothetical protein
MTDDKLNDANFEERGHLVAQWFMLAVIVLTSMCMLVPPHS